MIRLLICGICGKMGSLTANLADKDVSFKVLGGVDRINPVEYDFPVWQNFDDCPKADCIIDFSSPDTIKNIIDYAIVNLTPLVLATTGYNEHEIEFIKNASQNIPIFMSSNLSKGMNALIKASSLLCDTLGNEYDISISETHHRYKKDAPSGTAIKIKNALYPLCCKEIPMSSIRGGGVFGDHTVMFMSDNDVIEITHRALNRNIFAQGALEAAKFITGKKCGIYAEI